ncbi:MAG TPA: bifunctional UDP-N-acetylglucosamine diphosphorylase/glucosamine-1-phosphate N-acetyltransferase GlmU [Acidobacteriota bacterium]|nr:bifunctional UDP-N-acetylglucosamine diphosphorylase/glucosamine-1-phosphate N-acetyltransferase GlmU [Acidobacteriota bacterium]
MSNPSSQRSAVVLAAGQGTRFKSRRIKILHELCGKPMLLHILDKLKALEVGRAVLVVASEAEEVRRTVEDYAPPFDLQFAVQTKQLGTGHALATAVPYLPDQGSVLVLYGDTPLISPRTLQRLFQAVEEEGADEALLTAILDDPYGYGRILRDPEGNPLGTVEEKDADEAQRKIREVNSGFYGFKASVLKPALSELDNDNAAGEYYLTDLLDILRSGGKRVRAVMAEDASETLGVNDRLQLAHAEGLMRRQINRRWMREGVTMLDPSRVLIDAEVELARDVTLYPGVVLQGGTRIAEEVEVRSNCHLVNALVGRGTLLDQGTVIRDSSVGEEARVGPYAHLRGGTQAGDRVRIGNFVEVKKSILEEDAKAAHLTYLGDSSIGRQANIGAGTITCNYDGKRKYRTVIGERAFIGSNSQLVAPVTIGAGAYVAAGSTITEDVPPGALAIARSRQVVKPDWTPEDD